MLWTSIIKECLGSCVYKRSMTKFLPQAWFVILFDLLLTTWAQEVKHPYFYQNKTQRCNCKPNAQCNEQDGTCPGDKCASYYVGTNCQHASVRLLMSKDPINVPQELLDGNPSTCLDHYSGTAVFEVAKRMQYIWTYLVAKTSITVKPKLALYKSRSKQSEPFYTLKLTERSLLIKTRNHVMYDKLELSNLPEDSCSVEISLGRNLAISSTANEKRPQIQQTIDGDDSSPRNGFFLNETDSSKWWRTRLPHNARVNLLKLVSGIYKCVNWELELEFKSDESPPVVLTKAHGDANQGLQELSVFERIVIFDAKSYVTDVGFSCTNGYKASIFEVYIFGEFLCPGDWYGPTCERHCPEGCSREICDPDWGCPEGCNQNWKGLWCDRKSIATTTTTASTTTTTPATATTTTATAATTIEPITKTVANTTKGRTKRCNEFKYGPNCEHECNDNCAKEGLCDEDSGICNDGCKPGFIPPDCKTPCRKGTYSVNCSQTYENCAKNSSTGDAICDHSTGYCLFGCGKGYGGDKCEKLIVVSEFSILYTPINFALMGLLSVLLVALVRSFIKKGSQDSTIESDTSNPNHDESNIDDPQETKMTTTFEALSTSGADQAETPAVSGLISENSPAAFTPASKGGSEPSTISSLSSSDAASSIVAIPEGQTTDV